MGKEKAEVTGSQGKALLEKERVQTGQVNMSFSGLLLVTHTLAEKKQGGGGGEKGR